MGFTISRYGFTISVTCIDGSFSKKIGKLFFLNGSTFSLLLHLTLKLPTKSMGIGEPSKNVCAPHLKYRKNQTRWYEIIDKYRD